MTDNKKEIIQKLHEVLWDYISHSHASEEEWNDMLEDIYNRLKEKGVIK